MSWKLIMKKCLIIPLLTILVACSETPNPNSEVKQESQPSPKEQKQVEEGTLIPRSIEGDKGKYYLLDKKQSGDIVTTLHKRIGVDSVGYTLMNLNCKNGKVQELGYSEISPEEITQNPTDWYELVPGSSKYDLYQFVCN